MKDYKDLKKTIEEIYSDYAKKSKRELEQSKRILMFKNIKGARDSIKNLVGKVIKKGVLMEHTTPVYYFLGGFGNECLDNPSYETWRQNSIKVFNNLKNISEDK